MDGGGGVKYTLQVYQSTVVLCIVVLTCAKANMYLIFWFTVYNILICYAPEIEDFWKLVGARALIFHMNIPCDEIFL